MGDFVTYTIAGVKILRQQLKAKWNGQVKRGVLLLESLQCNTRRYCLQGPRVWLSPGAQQMSRQSLRAHHLLEYC